jgi:hypothetical protein
LLGFELLSGAGSAGCSGEPIKYPFLTGETVPLTAGTMNGVAPGKTRAEAGEIVPPGITIGTPLPAAIGGWNGATGCWNWPAG